MVVLIHRSVEAMRDAAGPSAARHAALGDGAGPLSTPIGTLIAGDSRSMLVAPYIHIYVTYRTLTSTVSSWYKVNLNARAPFHVSTRSGPRARESGAGGVSAWSIEVSDEQWEEARRLFNKGMPEIKTVVPLPSP